MLIELRDVTQQKWKPSRSQIPDNHVKKSLSLHSTPSRFMRSHYREGTRIYSVTTARYRSCSKLRSSSPCDVPTTFELHLNLFATLSHLFFSTTITNFGYPGSCSFQCTLRDPEDILLSRNTAIA